MTADLQETVGAVVRQERQERRLTMKELAQQAALSEVYLSEIERGKKYPSALVLERLAQALDLTTPDLLELVAERLRAATQPVVTRVIGFAPPTPRQTVKRLAQTLEADDVTMMAELGAFFLARRRGELEE